MLNISVPTINSLEIALYEIRLDERIALFGNLEVGNLFGIRVLVILRFHLLLKETNGRKRKSVDMQQKNSLINYHCRELRHRSLFILRLRAKT
jgi:hypothetical protein